MQNEKARIYVGMCYNPIEGKLHSHKKNYILRYFYNPDETFFHLFMHTIVYDKRTNENIEKKAYY